MKAAAASPARRIAVTGLGLMTGLGLDLQSSWAGLLRGESPIKPFSLFDPGELGAFYGVELPSGAEELFRERLPKRRRSQMTRGTMIACVAAEMALTDAQLDLDGIDRSRVGVVVGATGTGYAPTGESEDPHRILKNMANAAASWISLMFKLTGPAWVVSTACASGAYALAGAFGLIESGLCDVVVCGAADSSLSRADVAGFAALMALSERASPVAEASCPFDARRDGFVMGEGGGFLVVEHLTKAQERGAHVRAELARPALTSEGYNMIAPAPGGAGMAQAMQRALAQAGLTPSDVDYLNAHGTSTRLNDLYETQAIQEVFGERALDLPVSSTKALTGHCLAGAAGVEAVICCQALVEQTVPPTANLRFPDEALPLDYVPLHPRRVRLRHVMSNSFAFGGHNGVCVFSAPGVVG